MLVINIETLYILMVGDLPSHHADLFDRMLITQSLAEKLPVMTADKFFKKYPVDLVWAA